MPDTQPATSPSAGTLVLRIGDADSGAPLPARVYITDTAGRRHLVPSTPDGPVAHYDCTDAVTAIVETYSLLSAKAVRVSLPAARYRLTIERGKEYAPASVEITIAADRTVEHDIRLRRRFDMAALGWYSADAHVHTPLDDLPAAQLADDVNVAFPITAWATISDQVPTCPPPGRVPREGRCIRVDDSHAYWDLNTEYEIFHVGGELCILGAFLILGHRTPLALTAPPVYPIADEARRQGAILDVEKPTWPWSTMLVPVAGMHTLELSNNSMWRQRTIHHYLWDRTPPPWIEMPLDARRFVEYGFESFYAMLNAGFPLRPSAGSANGVHPVPLGQSRVYAHAPGPFGYDNWLTSFRRGRAFATNGPMIRLDVDGHAPGDRVKLRPDERTTVVASVECLAPDGLDDVALIVNGRAHSLTDGPATSRRSVAAADDDDVDVRAVEPIGDPAWQPAEARVLHRFRAEVRLHGSAWIAARCFERSPADNPRFAHSGAVFFDDPTRPTRLRPQQLRYLLDDLAAQRRRLGRKVPADALAEYERAAEMYRTATSRHVSNDPASP